MVIESVNALSVVTFCFTSRAPMPFLMGVHSSMMEQVRRMPVNDVVILDIDNDEIESPYYEDLLQLPVDIVSI